nr:uncharacterized protein LOC127329716 [Lolium perenne]
MWQRDKTSWFLMQGKTFGPEQATTMNTYKCMKVGAKKYKENGSNTSIENLKAKKRLDDYEKGLKSAYPEDWQERDLDPAVLYSTGGGMPHGRFPIGDGAFRKSEVVAAAKRSNIKPANSMSYQDLLRKNTFLEKKNKTYAKHMRFFYTNAEFPVPEDLQDDLMEDGVHVNQSSPSTENGGTQVMASSRAAEQSDTTPSGHLHTTQARDESPFLDE